MMLPERIYCNYEPETSAIEMHDNDILVLYEELFKGGAWIMLCILEKINDLCQKKVREFELKRKHV